MATGVKIWAIFWSAAEKQVDRTGKMNHLKRIGWKGLNSIYGRSIVCVSVCVFEGERKWTEHYVRRKKEGKYCDLSLHAIDGSGAEARSQRNKLISINIIRLGSWPELDRLERWRLLPMCFKFWAKRKLLLVLLLLLLLCLKEEAGIWVEIV